MTPAFISFIEILQYSDGSDHRCFSRTINICLIHSSKAKDANDEPLKESIRDNVHFNDYDTSTTAFVL